MEILLRLSNTFLPIAYLVLGYLYAVHFFQNERKLTPHLGVVLKSVLAVHLASIIMKAFYLGTLPAINIFEVISLIAFCITLIYVYIEHRIKIKSTGFFIILVAFLLQLIASSFSQIERVVPAILDSRMFVFHTSAAIIGYTALLISALYGLMYLMLFHQLKSARFGVVYRRMPSLEELNEMNSRAAAIGFTFLSITILLGILWRKDAFPTASHFDPKVVTSYGIWMLYGLFVLGQRVARVTGKWSAYFSVTGFILIVLSVIVLQMIVPSFHRFG